MADVQVTAIGNGVYRVDDGARSRIAYAAGPPDARWVFLDGRVYVVGVEDRSDAPRRSGTAPAAPGAAGRKRRDSHADLSAPMPASVLKITVEPGQRVSKGDVLIVLEAMKMELPIKAPRDATVKSLACRPGELVQPGVALLELG